MKVNLPALITIVILMGATLYLYNSSNHKQVPGIVIKTVDGSSINLANNLSGPVLIHFWSTTCGICIEEMPDLNNMYLNLHKQGLKVIAVALSHSPPNTVVEMIDRLAMPFPVALDLNDTISDAFGKISATPTTILISSNGEILKTHVGGGHLSTLENTIGKIINNNQSG